MVKAHPILCGESQRAPAVVVWLSQRSDSVAYQSGFCGRMRVVALETTGEVGSVAALVTGRLVASERLDRGRRLAQSLTPGLHKLLEKAGWRAQDVELVAVSLGPGSFTGLRVGITAAKIFAYAVEAALMGVSTFEAIAYLAPAGVDSLWVAMEAQRGQLFVAQLTRGQEGLLRLPIPLSENRSNIRLVDPPVWLAELKPDAWVTGPALKRLGASLPDKVRGLPESSWSASAVAVGELAERFFQAGHRDNPWQLAPVYVRPSAAEEKQR